MGTAHHERDDGDVWRVLKALGSPVRLEIVRYVHHHPRCICNEILLHLPDSYARAQSTLSQHLKILRDAEVIEADSDNGATCYTINQNCLEWLRSYLDELGNSA